LFTASNEIKALRALAVASLVPDALREPAVTTLVLEFDCDVTDIEIPAPTASAPATGLRSSAPRPDL
jgi:hypothetical protein